MTNTKICPACKKEVPIQAVRCKHCRIKISSPTEVFVPIAKPEISKPDFPPLSKKTLIGMQPVVIPPPKRTTLPPPFKPPQGVDEKESKREPSRPPRPSFMPVATNQPTKTSELDFEVLVSEATADMVMKSVGKEAEPVREKSLVIPDIFDDTEEISLDEISEIIPVAALEKANESPAAKTVDTSSSNIVTQAVSDAKPVLEATKKPISDKKPKTRSADFNALSKLTILLGKKLFPNIVLQAKTDKPSDILRKILSNIRILHVSLVLVSLVLLVIIAAIFSGGEKKEDLAAKTVNISADAKKTDVENPSQHRELKPKAGAIEKRALQVEPEVDTCKPLSQYPEFPWHQQIESLTKAIGVKGICELSKTDPARVTAVFSEQRKIGPVGYDLINGASKLEFFWEKQANRQAPSMSFLFVEDKIYEISLDYKEKYAKGISLTEFKEKLGEPQETSNIAENQTLSRFFDGDTIIEYLVKKDNYGRVFNKIVFSNKKTKESLGNADIARKKAEEDLERGIDLLGQRKNDEAVLAFQKAREDILSFGLSYVFEGISLVQKGEFEKAEKLAEQALEISRDARARAEAKGLMALAALREGDKNRALELFSSAEQLDPIQSEFKVSASELRTGKYDPRRVAKTAARLSCLKDKAAEGWTERDILVRGNFASREDYEKALAESQNRRGFKSEFERWVGWECQ